MHFEDAFRNIIAYTEGEWCSYRGVDCVHCDSVNIDIITESGRYFNKKKLIQVNFLIYEILISVFR